MLTLQQLEDEFVRMKQLVELALISESLSEKEDALLQVQNSEVITHSGGSLGVILHKFGATVKGIRTVNTLPGKIDQLKDLINQLKEQIEGFSKEEVLDKTDEKVVVKVDEAILEIVEIHNPLLEKLKIALNSYIKATNERTYEYYYGLVGTALSFFNLAGYSKSDKLDVVKKLMARATDPDAELTADDVYMLTHGVLGDAINPLLEDKEVGNLLRVALAVDGVKYGL